jgi:hypothetical protein
VECAIDLEERVEVTVTELGVVISDVVYNHQEELERELAGRHRNGYCGAQAADKSGWCNGGHHVSLARPPARSSPLVGWVTHHHKGMKLYCPTNFQQQIITASRKITPDAESVQLGC